MPKVKKSNSVIHPKSRKALQLARHVFHNDKLEKRKEESSLKQKAKLDKMKWFKGNIDATKEIYSAADVKELMDRYLSRFAEHEAKEKESKSLNRHLSCSTFLDFKTKFLVEKEKREFEASGIEIPDLMKKNAYTIFKAWNNDAELLAAIDTMNVSKRQLDHLISKTTETST